MDPEARFLATLRDRPYDHDTRLVYADWLEERGEVDRPAFLRLHVLGRAAVDIDSPHALHRRLDPAWCAVTHPNAARRHPLWLAAALGDADARAALGAYPPPALVDCPVVIPRYAELLEGWPVAVLARVARGAARHALEAVTPATGEDPELDRARAVLATLERDQVPASLEGAASALVTGQPTRPTVRWHAFVTLQWAVRAAEHDASGTPYALVNAAFAHAEVIWSRDDTRRLHRKAETAERAAAVAAQRSDALASARTTAAEIARAACPPAPDLVAIGRAVILALTPAVLAWLRAQPTDVIAPDRPPE